MAEIMRAAVTVTAVVVTVVATLLSSFNVWS